MKVKRAKRYFVVDQEQHGWWEQVAHFYTKASAVKYAKFLADSSKRRVRVIRTFPGTDEKPL